jgi:hypothetical protein
MLERHKREHLELDARLDSDLNRRQQNRELEDIARCLRGTFEEPFRKRQHADLDGIQERERLAMAEPHARERAP